MIVWRLGGKLIRIVICAVLCTTVVRNDMYTCEQFLNLHVGLGLHFVFTCYFRFTMYVFFLLAWIILFPCCLLLLCWIQFLENKPRDWLKNVSEMAYSMSSCT